MTTQFPGAQLLLLTLCIVSVAGPLCPTPARAAPERATFVGSQACASCHPNELKAWQGSHHDLAMQRATPDSVLGNFDGATFRHHNVVSHFARKGDRFFVTTDGPDGKLSEFEVLYTFGLHPLQQYMIAFPDGRVQVLGIAWDSRGKNEGGQRWFHIYPDEPLPHHDALHWTGPNQNWNHMCAECHSTNLRKNYDAGKDRFDTKWSEIDVACEACHGPGSRHVSRAKSGQYDPNDSGLEIQFESRKKVQWIPVEDAAGPRRSPPHTQDSEIDACARCHSRRSPIHGDYDFGRPLLDQHRVALLDEMFYFPDGQIDEEVYVYGSFVQSKMYRAGVTCSDCHDPHSARLRSEGNALCNRCHAPARFDTKAHHHHPAQSKGAQCVECHMPSKTYMEVDPRRDHSLRVPRPDLSDALGTPNACTGCHVTMTNAWASRQLAGWRGNRSLPPHWGQAIHAGRNSGRDAGALLIGVIADPEVPAIARATAVSLLAHNPSRQAGPAFGMALADPDPMVRTAAVGALQNLEAELLVSLVAGHLRDPIRAVRFEAARVLSEVSAAGLNPADQQALELVLDEYRAAQWMDADRGEARMRLGTLYTMQGDFAAAEAEYQAARKLAPWFIPAYVNLADLYRVLDRDGEGEAVLRRAIEIQSDNGDAHHALGLLLVRQKKTDEALQELAKAAALQPDNARYAFIHAVALQSSGQIAEAVAVLREASKRHPGDPQIASFLAQLEGRH